MYACVNFFVLSTTPLIHNISFNVCMALIYCICYVRFTTWNFIKRGTKVFTFSTGSETTIV